MEVLKTVLLFVMTAIAEIVGCYLPYLWLQKGKSPLLVIPAALSLAAFVWLLTLHPTATGRVYAAYGGIYVAVAVLWLTFVDGAKLSLTDTLGVGLVFVGSLIVIVGFRS